MFRAAGPMGASRTLEAGHRVKATAPFLWAVTLLTERLRGGVTQWEPQTRSELLGGLNVPVSSVRDRCSCPPARREPRSLQRS